MTMEYLRKSNSQHNEQTDDDTTYHQASVSHLLQQTHASPPGALKPANILHLQRLLGNQSVQRLLRNQPSSTRPKPTPQSQSSVISRKLIHGIPILDTENPVYEETIKGYLHKNKESLQSIKEFLSDHPSPRDQIFIKYINELIKTYIRDYNLALTKSQGHGIWTRAAIFVNDNLAHNTTAAESGHGEGSHSSLNPDEYHLDHDIRSRYEDEGEYDNDMAKSERDSEVSTLEEVKSFISKHANRINTMESGKIEIQLTGNMGPCKACQVRIKACLQDLRLLIYPTIDIIFDVSYSQESFGVTRGRVVTDYGYAERGQGRINASGNMFYYHIVNG